MNTNHNVRYHFNGMSGLIITLIIVGTLYSWFVFFTTFIVAKTLKLMGVL